MKRNEWFEGECGTYRKSNTFSFEYNLKMFSNFALKFAKILPSFAKALSL